METRDKSQWLKVWDPVVRLGHWVLVIAFFTAYLTEDEWLQSHVWAGYVVGAVVLFRVIWGVLGTRHARFSDFVLSPARVLRYLRGLVSGNVEQHVGHNPAGGWMIVLMLLCLSGVVYSGLMVHALENGAGPLAELVAAPPAETGATRNGHEDHDEDSDWERAEEFWEEVHEVVANLMLLLIILHVVGVLVSSRLHRENLVRAMVTGRKPAADFRDVP